MTKRERIIQEILDTEVTYIENLQLIIRHFLIPLRESDMIPPDARAAIFSNIEAILAVNRELLACMVQQSLGEAFLRLAPFLRLYSLYANNFQRANEALAEWTKKSGEFARFRAEQEAKPECSALGLPSLLIMPVQRVPRFKLLLDDLLKHTPQDDPEWAKLSSACHQIGQVTTHINEHIRTHENFRQMLRIQNSMAGSIDILAPGRRFIREGRLTKICKRKSKERACFLFSDLFIYARSNGTENAESFTCRAVLPLMFCSVARIDDETDTRAPGVSSFIRITCKDLSVLMYGKSSKEIQSWVDDLCKAIEELRDQQKTLLEQIKIRAGRDRSHKLRDRISRHLNSSTQKIERLNGSLSTCEEWEQVLANKEVDEDPQMEEIAEEKDIEEIEVNATLITPPVSGFCNWYCSPLTVARKAKTTTYDFQREKVSSTICVIV